MRVLARRVRGGGIVPSIGHVLRHPDRLVVHLRRLAIGDVSGVSNRYGITDHHGPVDRSLALRWVAAVSAAPVAAVQSTFDELEADADFFRALKARYAAARPEWVSSFEYGRFKLVYALVRVLRPRVVVETGVHDGLSSTLILKALARNDHGRLVSVDRPSSDLPVSASGAGWLIPQALRSRWDLRIGDSTRILPALAAEVGPIDMFMHDSDHSPSHRRFEFTTVRPHLSVRGVIVSDDDEPADGVLSELGAAWRMVYVPPPDGIRGIGALVRPDRA